MNHTPHVGAGLARERPLAEPNCQYELPLAAKQRAYPTTAVSLSPEDLSMRPALNDADSICFAPAAHEEECIAAADRVARTIEAAGGGLLSAEQAITLAQHVASLDIADVLLALDAEDRPARLLFLLVERLATADLDVAWRALGQLPLTLALMQSETDPAQAQLAYPSGDHTWASFAHTDASTWLWNPATSRLHGPVAAHPDFAIERSQGVLGFTALHVTRLALTREEGLANLPSVPAHDLRAYNLALFGGLLAGAMQRMVSAAYEYAKIRQSFGKPIAKHQAVALRLADLALNHNAARWFLMAELSEPKLDNAEHRAAVVAHVTELTYKIARDAVQIAAAHGYVEGLPFKRLFEKTRTLSTLLAYALS